MEDSRLAAILTVWGQQEIIADFDRHWGALLARLDPTASTAAVLAGVLARRAVDQGHVCVDLAELAGRRWPAADGVYRFPAPPELASELAASCLVAAPGDGEQGSEIAAAAPNTPLVLAGNLLYLRRYWQYEGDLAAAIRQRAAASPLGTGTAAGYAHEEAMAPLASLAAAAGVELAADQRRAILAAHQRRLTVISGGPGTGKTTIIFFILALSQSAAAANQAPSRVLLLAPTGKAAARLGQAVREKKTALAGLATVAELPEEAMTIHRALGYQPASPTVFRHTAANPLAADLVVVDEASMVDMALMSKLFAAVPATARLVLLGDKDQLASVEAGSILGDICAAAASPGGESPAAASDAARGALAAGVINLQQGFRFDPRRGIGALVSAVKAGEAGAALEVLAADHSGEVECHQVADATADPAFAQLITDGFQPALTANGPAQALEQLAAFRLLAPHRRGAAGVEELNQRCQGLLRQAGLLPAADGVWYRGRPLLITANDYHLRLFNGDLGVIWDSPEEQGELRAFFPTAEGRLRQLLPSRLPAHETAFALTIHKSQGSEFERVAVILPAATSPLLSRELLYTAISRARRQVLLFAEAAVIAEAIGHRVQRTSGLAARL
ncbi:MAG: exodeoxyribonuclease V subunit alpha [Desulfurivibrio sp.]|nr:exodeoxyribonuclease V subunit alpha [Desulfurivibrio sp.]